MKTLFAISFFIFVTIVFGEPKRTVVSEQTFNQESIKQDSLNKPVNTPCFESVMDSLSNIHQYNESLKRKLNKIKKQKNNKESL